MNANYENLHLAPPRDIVTSAQLLVHKDELGPPPRDTTFFPAHWHDALEILVVLEGQIAVRTDSGVLHANAGESILIASNQIHSPCSDPVDSNSLYLCLIVHKSFLEEFDLPIRAFSNQQLGFNKDATQLVTGIYEEHVSKSPHHTALIRAKVLELLVFLLRSCVTTDYVEDDIEHRHVSAVKAAIDYINMNFNRNITLEEICAEACLSRYYLSRIFKESTGQTISDFIMNQRCTHAQELIASGSYSLTQVAEMCGFNSSTYFSTVFKKCKGVTPSQLLKNVQSSQRTLQEDTGTVL